MIFLPIVGRELRVTARLTATYRNRVIIAGIVTVAAMIMLVFGVFSDTPSEVGRSTFWSLAYFTLAFCLFEGVRKTADCLSEEKREGTLGLLFLTDLRGYDIILGKLAATSLNSIYGLISILPVLALPLLLGGVTPGEFWRVTLALLNILFFSLSTGMLVSAVSRRERLASGGTFTLITLIAALPLLTFNHACFQFSPVYAFYAAGASSYSTAAQSYWRSLQITHALSWSLLLLASLLAPRCWQDEQILARSSRWWRRRHSAPSNDLQRITRRAQMLDINPAFWLARRNSGPRLLLSIGIAVAAGGAAVFAFVSDADAMPMFLGMCLLLNFILKLRVAAQACHCLAEARRNNALEMLLATPLSVERIIQGQLLALKRMFLVPIITILALEVIGLLAGSVSAARAAAAHGNTVVENAFFTTVAIGLVIVYLALFVLDIFAVIWAGMWFGLSSKRESQAVTKTILIALVLPMVSGIFLCYGFPFVTGIPIFLIVWGGQKLRREFRNLAAQTYRPLQQDSNWLPGK